MTSVILDKEFFHCTSICEFFFFLFPLVLLAILAIKFFKKMEPFAETFENDANLVVEKSFIY